MMQDREPTTRDLKAAILKNLWENYKDRLRPLAHQVIEHGAKLNDREVNMVKFMLTEMQRIAGHYELDVKCITTALYREGVLLGCQEGKCTNLP